MLRVAGGQAKGRKLRTVKGLSVRPTTDKVRQSIFNVLGHNWAGKRVLDLFAGTGALGIEALSHDAEFVVFVDEGRHAEQAIRENLCACGFGTRADVLRERYPKVLRRLEKRGDRFDVVLLDPPYGQDAVNHALKPLLTTDILTPDAVIVAEHDASDNVRAEVLGLVHVQTKRYGSTAVTYAELA